MSQHDYNIANQTAINFRSDLNTALGALVSNSSGDAEPNTMYPNMFWYDSADNLLKMRNETNDSWIIIGNINQVDGVFRPYINNKWVRDFLDEDTLVSDSANSVPSQQSVKAYVDSNISALSFPSLGEGQAWQDTTSSRAAGTAYRNTEGRTIQVAITGNRDSDDNDLSFYVQVRSNGQTVNWITVGEFTANNANERVTITAVVPPDHFYRAIFEDGSLASWAELREDT